MKSVLKTKRIFRQYLNSQLRTYFARFFLVYFTSVIVTTVQAIDLNSPQIQSSKTFQFKTSPCPNFNTCHFLHIDPKHIYTLPELIDIAQRLNPETRMAWELSQQAAFAVGLSKAAYLPQLSAVVLGGQQSTPLPIPELFLPLGVKNFTLSTNEILPSLVIEWLLFDFGKRTSEINSAKNLSFAAKAGFTGAHQKLIFEVCKAYFALDAVRAQAHVANMALKKALIMQKAAAFKYSRGLETITQIAVSKRETAKSQFQLEQAKAAEQEVYHTLLRIMGLNPTLKLQIATSSNRQIPHRLLAKVETYIENALAKRPDIVSAAAKLRANEDKTKSAIASYRPTLGFEGAVYQGIGTLAFGNFPTNSVNKPGAAFLLKLKLPLYDGGMRGNLLLIARSNEEKARQELVKLQNEAIEQVATAYDQVNSALAEYAAAKALLKAASVAYNATFDAYKQGLETFPNTVSAETERAYASYTLAHAHSSVMTAAAALAFSTGELSSSQSLDKNG